jgi:hypothetical protein
MSERAIVSDISSAGSKARAWLSVNLNSYSRLESAINDGKSGADGFASLCRMRPARPSFLQKYCRFPDHKMFKD